MAAALLHPVCHGCWVVHTLVVDIWRRRQGADLSPVWPTCRWLGLHAFNRVLRRKPARYSALLRALGELLEAPASRQLARALAGVLDNQHSDVFQQIRY